MERNDKNRTPIRYHVISSMVIAFCAVVVICMRIGMIPSTVNAFGIGFPLSDFFIIVGAGLCGYKYGLGLFLIVYVAELIFRQGGILQSFSLFLYLAVALLSGVIAQKRWYLEKKKTLLAALLLETTLGSLFYVIFAFIFRSSWTNLHQSVVATIPETIVAVFFLYFYYWFAPDSLKNTFGLGYLYINRIDENVGEKSETTSSLGRQITALSLAESVIFGMISAMLTDGLLTAFVGEQERFEIMGGIEEIPLDFSREMLIITGFLFGWMLSLAVSVIVNEIIVGNIIAIVRKQGNLEMALAVAEAGSEAKSVFLSAMSHEIRTPINAVLGMDEMILRDSREEKTLEYAENIRVAGNTLLGLINDVLDFSKIEAGKMDIIPAEYDPASMLHDLVVMISIRAQKKALALETRIAADIPSTLYGDEIRIKQVITNILTNAVKYTEKGSVTITVSAEKLGEDSVKLFVSVKDTGIGIKEEYIEKLYHAFERIEEKRNRNIEGTGLGMNITTSLLEMMGSHLQVKSEYGKGSEFSFELIQKVISWTPIGNFETAWKETAKHNRKHTVSFTAPEAHILAVDDTLMNLTVLEGLLKPTKIMIDTAESGKDCLQMIKEKHYDLIFLDHRMPEMDGIETRHRMKVLEGNLNVDTPVIALTANAAAGAKEEYLGYGFTDYLTKPVSAASLQKMILKYLPADKVKEGAAEVVLEEAAIELPPVDGIDWEYARLHLQEEELLRKAMIDFYNCINLHADRLDGIYERLPDQNAFDEYRVLVHGMKSSAATVGIIPLAGMAKELENASAGKQEGIIRSLHEIFIREWRSYSGMLKGIMGLGADDDDKKDFDKDTVKGLLEILRLAMDEYDVDKADEMLNHLSGFKLSENIQKDVDVLKAAVADVDAEETERLVREINKKLEESV